MLASLPSAAGALLAADGPDDAGDIVPLVARLPAGTVLAELPESERNGLLSNEFIGPGAQLAISFDGHDRSAIPFVSPPESAAEGPARPEVPGPPAIQDLGAPFICTANWVFKDQAGKLYLGTAGHCVLPTTAEATHGAGAANASGVRVYACRSNCPLGGTLGGIHANSAAAGPASDWVELGAVAYARQRTGTSQIGHDFAVIEIPEDLHSSVSPALAGWGGPNGPATGATRDDYILLHGNGVGVAETAATKSRIGRIFAVGANSWQAEIPGNGGDSGSPVGHVAADALLAGDLSIGALGLLTHKSITLDKAVPTVSYQYGTTLPRALAMAETDAGLCLRLVLQGEDPATAASGAC